MRADRQEPCGDVFQSVLADLGAAKFDVPDQLFVVGEQSKRRYLRENLAKLMVGAANRPALA